MTQRERCAGGRFHVTTRVGDRTLVFRSRVQDPFVRATVHVGTWDILRALLRGRPVEVTVIVGGDRDAVDAVLANEGVTL